MIGETVGSYKILSKLSVGGMGTVYRAEHTLIGKLAAVKVLHKELSGSRDIVNRFFNEAKATTAIKHPGIVEVFDFGYMQSGDAFLIMEFLEGMSLARRLKTKGRMAEGEAAMMLRSVCSALSAAHIKGIVHRDLKPDNIFMVTDADSPTGDRPKVLDFGIAKLTDIGLAGTATKTGAVMGTPTYMSPEQCKGTGDVDHRADLYSIGCIFYELVCGRPPFTKLGAGELIGAHIYAQPEPPTKYNPDLSAETTKLIMALLHKRAEKRPQSAKELAQRLSVLAQSLGWITVTSPDGVTARGLRDFSSGPVMVPATTVDQNLLDTVLPSLESPDNPEATTPYGLDSPDPSIFVDHSEIPVDKPTTLGGAASESVISAVNLKRRSRKGIVIAMLSAAVIGGAAVVVMKMNDGDNTVQAAPQPAPKVDPPKPDRPDPPKLDPPPPAQVTIDHETKDPPAVPPAPKADPPRPRQVVRTNIKRTVTKPGDGTQTGSAATTNPTQTTGSGSAAKPPVDCKPPQCLDKTPL